MKNHKYRNLQIRELKILNKLLEKSFPGSKEISQQIASSKARDVFDKSGNFWGIEFRIDSNEIANVKKRVPVEAITYENNVPVQILLHIVNGKVKELELVRFDDVPPVGFPNPEVLEVKVNEKY